MSATSLIDIAGRREVDHNWYDYKGRDDFRQRYHNVSYSAIVFFFSSRRRHTRFDCDWSSDVCSSDLTRKGRRCGRMTMTRRARLRHPSVTRKLSRNSAEWQTASIRKRGGLAAVTGETDRKSVG